MNINRNYQTDMERIITQTADTRQRLLLHSCCAPCSSYVLECLSPHFDTTIFFYNPNIYPLSEYEYRKSEQLRLIREGAYKGVNFIDADYRHNQFLSVADGYEECQEGGVRCKHCIFLRLEETAKKAANIGFSLFASTLTVSPHKDAVFINQTGESLAEKYGISWLPSDFKKKDGFRRSIELSKMHRLYRQDYCGCEFSFKSKSSSVPAVSSEEER